MPSRSAIASRKVTNCHCKSMSDSVPARNHPELLAGYQQLRVAPSLLLWECLPRTLLAMRLLDRYLLREVLVPLFYCLSGFLLLWISFDMIAQLKYLQEQKLHASDIA